MSKYRVIKDFNKFIEPKKNYRIERKEFIWVWLMLPIPFVGKWVPLIPVPWFSWEQIKPYNQYWLSREQVDSYLVHLKSEEIVDIYTL